MPPKNKMIIMRGLPGSGKSTYAKKLANDKGQSPRVRRVNRDDVRIMLGVYNDFTTQREDIVTAAIESAVKAALDYGDTVIIDDCNLNPAYMANWKHIAGLWGVAVEVVDYTDVSLRECLKRNRERTGVARVENRVIHQMYEKWLKPAPPLRNSSLPTCIIVDMDGTLAIMGKRSPYDAKNCDTLDSINPSVSKLVHKYTAAGHALIVMSGREDKDRPPTHRFLKLHGFHDYAKLLMRATGDHRPDFIVKRELYEEHIAGRYNVELCLDDRDQVVDLWRSMGLPCFQVDEGDF